MTSTFDMLLNIILLISLFIYAYVVYTCEIRYKSPYEILDGENSKLSINENTNDAKFNVSEHNFIGSLNKKEKLEFKENTKIQLELKKYNRQLKRSLSTLSYIALMESNCSENKDRLMDLINLKQNVKHEVVRLTKQINYCKSFIEDSIEA